MMAGVNETMTSPFRTANKIVYTEDVVTCATDHNHANVGGTIHGGLLMSMLDAIMGGQVIRALPAGRTAVTASMTTSFLNPAFVGDVLQARADIKRIGNTLAYVDGVVTRQGEETPIATASGVFALIARPAR